MKTIAEIKNALQAVQALDDEVLKIHQNDSRKAVQALVRTSKRRIVQQQRMKEKFIEMSQFECDLRKQGYQFIAGIDEAGRGPLAGPVVAGAVILPTDFVLYGLNDSKQITEKKRELFYEYIQEQALAVGVGVATASEIDAVNIYEATKLAMQRAIASLNPQPDFLLLDAMNLPVKTAQMSLVKGDARSISIAAGSIIAKVTRDRMMKDYAKQHPQYGFDKHMGYGTKEHLAAIRDYGSVEWHRLSFAPLKK